ncbi:hypothetical protein K2X30_05510 [bacterium]|jgi:hypothetical protein|nr:hypothetical protein [bacterium]
MKKQITLGVCAASLLALGLGSPVFADDSAAPAKTEKSDKKGGDKECKNCHHAKKDCDCHGKDKKKDKKDEAKS